SSMAICRPNPRWRDRTRSIRIRGGGIKSPDSGFGKALVSCDPVTKNALASARAFCFMHLELAKDAPIKPLLVIPAKAGIQRLQTVAEALDPSFRWDDGLFRPSPTATNMRSTSGPEQRPAATHFRLSNPKPRIRAL